MAIGRRARGRRGSRAALPDAGLRTAGVPALGEEEFDAVVVGSGFGGSVVACRLAEEGRHVLVLERGQPYPPGSFPRTPRELGEAFWDPERGLHGLFELWRFGGLNLVCASGLGGGSLIYANVLLRKDADTFVREELAAGGREHWPIGAQELEPHYENVLARLAPQPYPSGAEPYASTPKAGAMQEAADALGLRAERPPLAVLFAPEDGAEPVPGAPVAGENLHGLPRSTCRLCGECDIGCNVGAKNTLDYTYLSAAQRAGAALRTCCEVRTIAPLGGEDGGYRIGYRQHLGAARDRHRPKLLDPTREPWRTVRARCVVLAGGTVGSTRLLLANRAALPGLSPALGTRVSGNGDGIAWIRDARRPGADGSLEPRYLDPSRGPVITSSIRVPDGRSASGRGYRIQDAGAPAIGDWFWESLELPKLPWRMRRTILRMGWEAIAGRRDTNLGAEAAGLFTDRSATLLPLLGMGRDVPDGRFVLDGDRLALDRSPEPSKAYYEALEDGFRDVAEALGGKLVRFPWKRLNRTTTAHPLGGCPMADDPRHGVVSSHGRVFGFPGLHVADGAAMPGPVGPNPSLTIAAFADRVADGILGAGR
jgi:cholesterol oxidase